MLLRVYTQNIDALEAKASLSTHWMHNGLEKDTPRCIPLHGTVDHVRCTECSSVFLQGACHDAMITGQLPPCITCPRLAKERTQRTDINLRPREPQGMLRPDIVLYDEQHPDGSNIWETTEKDRLKHDLLLIVGTSLQIPGVKDMIDRFMVPSRTNSSAPKAILVDSKLDDAHIKFKSRFPGMLAVEWDCQELAARVMGMLSLKDVVEASLSHSIHVLSNYS